MISFVIPCYRSSQTIGKVVQEIETTMTDSEYEVILVDATESPIERPQKSKDGTIPGRKSAIP